MTLQGYSKCRIQFIPTSRIGSQRDYSDRSVIELRQDDNGEYSLRGVDVQNNKAEIFKCQLVPTGLYKFGHSIRNFDEICLKDGAYRLFLDNETKEAFYEELRRCLKELSLLDQNASSGDSKNNPHNEIQDIPREISDQDNILVDIHKLEEYLKEGNEEEAERLARKLSGANVRLRVESQNRKSNDEKIPIRVKIDGIGMPNKNTDEVCVLNVYNSTTIQDLRKLFQVVCGYPLSDQYFFVNGHLAYGEFTMEDLEAYKNPLFVLFLTSDHSKLSCKF